MPKKCNFEAGDKWYERELESFLENEDYKIFWDFSIHTDHIIETRRPDLVVVDKKERICKIIEFAVPGDLRRRRKIDRKISRHGKGVPEDMKCQSEDHTVSCRLFRCYTQVCNRLKQIGITVGTAQVQKTVLLGTARILRKVLEI